MLVNFKLALTDAYGEEIKAGDGKVMTLGRACVMALSEGVMNEQDKDDSEKKTKRFLLAIKVADSETSGMPLELDSNQVVMIKERLGKVFLNAAIVGRASELIEPSKPE